MRDYGMRGYTRRSLDACNPTEFTHSPRRTQPVTLRMLTDGQLPEYLSAPDDEPAADGTGGPAR